MDEIEMEIEDGHIRSSMEIQMIPLLDPRCAQWQVSSHPAPSFLHLNLSSVIVTSVRPSLPRGIWSRNNSRNNGRQVNASKASMASQR